MLKTALPFDPKRPRTPLMPDPNAGDVVARASIEVPDPSFEVVLRKGDHIRTIFLRGQPGGPWAGVIGEVRPVRDLEQLQREMLAAVDAAIADGWTVAEDDRD